METYFSGNVRVQELTDLIVEKLFTVCLLSGKDAADEFAKGRAAVEKLGQILLDLRSLSQAALVDGLIQLVEQRFPDRRVTNNFPSMRSTLEDMVKEGVAHLSAFFPAVPGADSSVSIKQELVGEGSTKVVLPGGKTPVTPVTSAEPEMPVRSDHWNLASQLGSAVVRVEKSMITGNTIGGAAGQPLKKDGAAGQTPKKDEVAAQAPKKDEVAGQLPKKDELVGQLPKKDEILPAAEADVSKESEEKDTPAVQLTALNFVIDPRPVMINPTTARVWPPLLQNARPGESDDEKKPATKIESAVILESMLSEVKGSVTKVEAKPAEVKESVAKVEPKPPEVKESVAKVEPKPAEVKESVVKVEPKPPKVKESAVKVVAKAPEFKESVAKTEPKPAEAKVSAAKAEAGPPESAGREGKVKALFGREPVPTEVGREPLSTEKEAVKSAAPGPNRGLPRQSPLSPEAIRLGPVLKYLFPGERIRWDISLANCPILAQVADLLVHVGDGPDLHPSVPLLKKEGWKVVVFSREDISFPRRMERMIRLVTRQASSQ
ncbi:hypothetical protein CEB3_c49370 [Peptococcaceae bacterium CEB3]|nr:hypothetical protein CEB3_c49370 [Peptococcaceae bacterium CEB3]